MGETTWRGVTIAWARPTELQGFTEADLGRMGRAQLERYRRTDASRARGFLAGRALIRELVVGLGGGPDVPLDSVCERCGEDHAAPRTPGFVISVSHADDLVVAAAAPTGAALAVGVDVEARAGEARMRDLVPWFAPESPPDLARWTRIEAVLKADGRGIRVDPRAVRLRVDAQAEEGTAGWSAELPGGGERLRVATLPGPSGFVLSAARD